VAETRHERLLDRNVGGHVRVHLRAVCDGGDSPHFPAEDGAQDRITAMAPGTTHACFVLFSGRPVRAIVAGLPKTVLGRHYAPDELELLGAHWPVVRLVWA